jgi:hypothetical protein
VWFGMDFQGAAGKEVAALQSRQQYLAVLAEQRNCGTPSSAPIATAATPAVHTTLPSASAPSPPPPPPTALTSAAVTPAPTPADAWPNVIPPLSASTAPAPAPPQPVAAVSPPPQASAATPDSYEQSMTQYRQAEQEYQRQLKLQSAQQGR